MQHAQIELAVGHAALGRLGEPFGGQFELLVAHFATGIESRQIVHGHAIAALGAALVPQPRLFEVLFDPGADLVEIAQPILCGHETLGRRPLIPARRFLEVLGHDPAFPEDGRHLELRLGIALGGRFAQLERANRLWRQVKAFGNGRDSGRGRGDRSGHDRSLFGLGHSQRDASALGLQRRRHRRRRGQAGRAPKAHRVERASETRDE